MWLWVDESTMIGCASHVASIKVATKAVSGFGRNNVKGKNGLCQWLSYTIDIDMAIGTPLLDSSVDTARC
jgi:hypothetical protein